MIRQNLQSIHSNNVHWLVFSGDQLLVREVAEGDWQIPFGQLQSLAFVDAYQEQMVEVGEFEQQTCIMVDMGAEQIELTDNLLLVSLRNFLLQHQGSWLELVSRAWQVAQFQRTHRFCGQCGMPMQQIDWEMARQCFQCGHRCYPRYSPCIIVGIRKDDKILLAQGKAQRNRNLFSVLAGFVESGESLEQAVHREVFEEAGIKVKNLRYFASQPWPFPHSLMMGFLADYDSGEIQVDGEEILEADWYLPEQLPNIPAKISIAGQIIEQVMTEIKAWRNAQN